MLAVQPIKAMSTQAIEKVRALETLAAELPQVPMPTDHVFHAGVYARTVMIPAGVMITGALIKIATTLVLNGDATVFTGKGTVHMTGYHVIPAAAQRKQAFYAHTDTHLTMIFATAATTIEDAEAEFTDEVNLLCSRKGNKNTGGKVCQE